MLRGATFSAEPSGLDYLAAIKSLSGRAREDVTLQYARERWLPPSMTSFSSWPVAVIAGKDTLGKPHVLEVQVAPDFFKVGSSEDSSVMAPMWPTTAQDVADELKLRTIGKPLARAIFESAKVKGSLYLSNPGEPFYDLKNGTPRNIEDSAAWASSDRKRQKWLAEQVPIADRAKVLVAGHAKDVVHQGSALSAGSVPGGKRLAIYGGFGGKVDGWGIQPFPGPHDWSYGPDYSHGIRFVRKKATLDGKRVLLDDVAKDPVLWPLLSEAGPYNNRMSFPGKVVGLASGESFDEDDYVPSGKPGDEDEPPIEPAPPGVAEDSDGTSVVPYALGAVAVFGALRWLGRTR